MKMPKLSNLLDKDLKIVEKKKIFFLIPLCIVVLTAVLMIIYNFAFGSPVNLGMDFAGGYSINVKIGTRLTNKTADTYKENVRKIVEGLENSEGKPYNIKVSSMQIQGSGDDAAVYVKYKGVASDALMEDINAELEEALRNNIGATMPLSATVSEADNTVTFEYGEVIVSNRFKDFQPKIVELFGDNGLTVAISDVTLSSDLKSIVVKCASVTSVDTKVLSDGMALADPYAVTVGKGNMTSATVSGELLTTALLAIILAIALMLVYIAIRFEFSSGLAAVTALFHDILIMICFMFIFRIELTSTFIAALITILGYSINNTIIIFDRVRENLKNAKGQNLQYNLIANRSVTETMLRSINTTLTTLFTIGMVAIIGVSSIRIFALPIIIGLLAGTYSSICIAPSVWSLMKNRGKKNKDKAEKPTAPAKESDNAVTA